MNLTRFTVGALALVIVEAGVASATYYDLGKNGDNKTNVSWESRATVELMVGRSVKISGFAFFDDRPNAGRNPAHMFQVAIPVTSMQTGIAMRDSHLAGPDWLDAEKYPNIEFKSTQITAVRGAKDTYKIVGDLTIHGVTKRVTTTGTAKRIAAIPSLERMGYKGDIIHLVTKFNVKLSDFNVIVPAGMLGTKVANEVVIQFDVFGFTNNDPDRLPEGVAAVVAPQSVRPTPRPTAPPPAAHTGH